MRYQFAKDLGNHLADHFNTGPVAIQPELCPAEFDGDLTVNCFLLAKHFRRSPMEIAGVSADFLAGHPEIVRSESIKAFVNVVVCPEALCRDTIQNESVLMADPLLPREERRKILIEYSAPNTNKPQHLGHVRNNSLGMALVALLERVGHKVIPVNLVNDRGIHICKSMLAYQRWGEGATPQSSGKKGDHFVGDFYVKFDSELKKQLCGLREENSELADVADEDLFLETEIGRAAQEMLVAWEKHDPEVRKLWAKMNSWVIAGFEETYVRMGAVFEHTYLESETYSYGKKIVEDGVSEGVFTKRPDAAVTIDLDENDLGEKVVLRSDGTSVYVTQDIGTTLLKHRHYTPDSMIWVVGDEQIYHFRVLFAILRALGYEWADNLTHMAYGMVNLPSGRMKSREGTVVDADDLFTEMEELARKATLEKAGKNAPPDIDKRAEIISMAALKFMLLKTNPGTTLMFDPEASVRFEGDTGPYVLYACARISSILRKADPATRDQEINWKLLSTNEEKDLAIRCGEYGRILQKSAHNLDTSLLAGYLLDLAKSFSRFYRACPVLQAESPELRDARLAVAARTRMVLKDGLNALTIETLESM